MIFPFIHPGPLGLPWEVWGPEPSKAAEEKDFRAWLWDGIVPKLSGPLQRVVSLHFGCVCFGLGPLNLEKVEICWNILRLGGRILNPWSLFQKLSERYPRGGISQAPKDATVRRKTGTWAARQWAKKGTNLHLAFHLAANNVFIARDSWVRSRGHPSCFLTSL